MYAGDLTPRDRAGPIIAVVLVHAALAFMLLTMSGHLSIPMVEQALKMIDVTPPVLPPSPPPPRVSRASAKPKAAAPPAKKAEASPVVAPKPRLILPIPSPIVAAPVPAQGSASSQGAATAGAGSGAGGRGNGTGGGGDGDEGSGTHPRPMFRPLNPRGFPRALVEPLPPGARVFIMFTVQLDGHITDCTIRESSGTPALDALVCQVAQQRFRYEPARRGDGRAYVAKSAYMQVF